MYIMPFRFLLWNLSMTRRLLLPLVCLATLLSGCTYMPAMSEYILRYLGLPPCIAEPQPATEPDPGREFAWPEPSPEFLADFDAQAPFPLDPVVQMGQLDNGFTYYIVPNDDPPDRARFALVVDAGAIDEDEDQLGIAHFLEHMMFNGTENFSPEELREYFEANGMTLGQHLNASTGHEQTTYYLNVDAANEEVMTQAFVVLGDWAMRALLDQEEVDKEKGVVEEEWRLRTENSWGRIQEQILQTLLAGSRYAERNVIGDMDIIRELTSETLRRYYEDWYRPDLMTLVVTGSVDPAWVQEQIHVQFGEMTPGPDPRPSLQPSIPLKEDISIEILSDPELPVVSLEVLQLIRTVPVDILQDARRVLIEDLAVEMFNERLGRLGRSPDSEFQSAWLSTGQLGIGGVSIISLNTHLDEDKVLPGFTAALTEMLRAQHHGFAESELHRAKLNLLEAFDSEFAALPTRRNRQIQGEILRHILYGSPMSGIAFEFDLAKHYLPDISLAEVNSYMAEALDVHKSLVLLTAPEKDDLVLPDAEQVQLALDQTLALPLEPYQDDSLVAGTQLLGDLPLPASILQETYDERLDLTVLTYANGVTALLKPTDLEENRVQLDIVSKGGHSRVADEAFFATQLVAQVAAESGAGPYDFDSLDQLLAGQTVHLSPYLEDLTEGYWGSATTDDLETLFQLAHLSLTQPRFDEQPFRNVLDNQRVNLQNQELDPFFQLYRHLQTVLYGDAPRKRIMLAADLEAIDFAETQQVHAARLAALDAPVLLLVGDFDLAEGKQLVSTYIGSLPQVSPTETWEDRTVPARTGPFQERIYHGQASQVFVVQILINDQIPELSPEDRVAMEALSRILRTRYDRQIREELGGAYAVQAGVSVQRLPRPQASLTIFFGTGEEQLEELLAASRAILEDVLAQGVTPEEVDAAKAQLQLQLETSRTTNRYWLRALRTEFLYGEAQLERIDQRAAHVASVTPEQIKRLIPLVVNTDKLVELVQLPEASAPAD